MSKFESHFKQHIQIASKTLEYVSSDVERACILLQDTLLGNSKLLVGGNGGSASDASHFCTELVCAYQNRQREGIPAISLSSDPSLLTAVSNDFSFETIFTRQISTFYQSGDAVILISTSGTSPNFLNALNYCGDMGIPVILLTSTRFSQDLAPQESVCISVPSQLTAFTQEMHIIILHIIADYLESTISS